MPLEVKADHSVSKRQTVVQSTTHVKITGTTFDFDDEWLGLGLTYGTKVDGKLRPFKTEVLIFSGPPLLTFMMQPSSGATRYASIMDVVKDIVAYIQSPNRRQQLIDDGHLVITNGSLKVSAFGSKFE